MSYVRRQRFSWARIKLSNYLLISQLYSLGLSTSWSCLVISFWKSFKILSNFQVIVLYFLLVLFHLLLIKVRLVFLISHCLLFNVLPCLFLWRLLYYTRGIITCQLFFKIFFKTFNRVFSIFKGSTIFAFQWLFSPTDIEYISTIKNKSQQLF